MHGDKCREFIRANTPGFNLANEFIASVDPDHEDRVWQRFQTPADILPELQEWLGVEVVKPVREAIPGLPQGIIPARKLSQPARASSVGDALEKTRAWLASSEGLNQLEGLSPPNAAETALAKFHELLNARGAGQ